jgi:hypothetical protein
MQKRVSTKCRGLLSTQFPRQTCYFLQDKDLVSLVDFFSSVAHVWVPGAKTTGPIVEKFGFS